MRDAAFWCLSQTANKLKSEIPTQNYARYPVRDVWSSDSNTKDAERTEVDTWS